MPEAPCRCWWCGWLGAICLCLLLPGCVEPPDASKLPQCAVGLELAVPPPPVGQPISGRLTELVHRLPRVRDECRPIRFPSPLERQLFRRALALLLHRDEGAARAALALVGFELLRLSRAGGWLWLVRETPGAGQRGWGFYAVDPAPRRALVLEAPHPQHDRFTGEQAARLMQRLGARALLVATTHRCASKRPTACDGLSGACRQVWGRGRYRRSDRAHAVNTLFQAAHVELLRQEPGLVAVQLHGFARRPGRRRHLILSDGTRRPGRRGNWANALARAVRAQLSRRRGRLVVSCNETSRWRALCGTHNVQGRQANGSPDPCRRQPWRSRNRFVQVEQSLDARQPGGLLQPELLARALQRVFRPAPTGAGRDLPLAPGDRSAQVLEGDAP